MEYHKIANLLESTSDSQSKFRTRNWVKINDESRGIMQIAIFDYSAKI